ncbi:DUF3848 domain-containing protein [Clostridiaceae bacterium M8S5]|nr:DUF3848 domain-containing protein [Clostridiaceae bacterium M8S5]
MELKERVCEKMKEELETRLQEISQLHPEGIIDRAYEITVKQELVMIIENEEIDKRTFEVLDKLECPLSSIYTEWLENDCSMLDDLKSTITETAEQMEDQLVFEMEI